jgi:hypothetical protein
VALLASQEKSEQKPHGRKEKCRGVGTRDALVLIPPALCMLISFLALLVLSLCPKLHTPVLDILALAGCHPTVSNFPCIKPTSGLFSPSACSSWKTIIGTVTSPWCIPTKSSSSLFATLRFIFPDL